MIEFSFWNEYDGIHFKGQAVYDALDNEKVINDACRQFKESLISALKMGAYTEQQIKASE